MGKESTTDREELPLGFNVIMRSDIWPFGEGVVHNDENPCVRAPDSGAKTDLHTTPSAGKRLCRDCRWPPNAKEALNYDD